MDAMSVAQLKAELRMRGVSTQGMVDRAELVGALAVARAAAAAAPSAAPAAGSSGAAAIPMGHTHARCSQCGARPSELREGRPLELLLCSRCGDVYYCSAACQKQHWPTHKPVCKKREKAHKKITVDSFAHVRGGPLAKRAAGEAAMRASQAQGAGDFALAAREYARAADAGFTVAQTNLAALLLKGVPGQVPRDVPRAVRYLREAAAVGDLIACFNLGALLLKGEEGVPVDVPGAIPLLRRAAESGDTDAARLLASIHRAGSEGVPASAALADKYDKLAAPGGPPRMGSALDDMLRMTTLLQSAMAGAGPDPPPDALGRMPNPLFGNTALKEALRDSMASMMGVLGLRPGSRVRVESPGHALHGAKGRVVRALGLEEGPGGVAGGAEGLEARLSASGGSTEGFLRFLIACDHDGKERAVGIRDLVGEDDSLGAHFGGRD